MFISKLYISGMGMVTPLGPNVAMTSASLDAGLSAYEGARYYTKGGKAITMARVPDNMLGQFNGEIEEGDVFNDRRDRIIKMAIMAIREACLEKKADRPIPMFIGMSDYTPEEGLSPLVENIAKNVPSWVTPALSRKVYGGRASGIDAIDLAFKVAEQNEFPYILVGGSDSHDDFERLLTLENDDRLLLAGVSDGFVPGEAASFLLLTPHVELAQVLNGYAIALNKPGISEEKGHMFSDEPFRGDGLDQAFKAALSGRKGNSIQCIYGSMNGEHHWAKEYGVAFMRNQAAFAESVEFVHPSDCYGDIGSATLSTLIALASDKLQKNSRSFSKLVYASSDSEKRGAIVVEKVEAASLVNAIQDANHL